MRNTPIDFKTVEAEIRHSRIEDFSKASIRELVRLVNCIEKKSGQKFVRMEMGVPGLEPPAIGTEAEIAALRKGVASKYPMIEGISELKEETAKFAKLFMDIEVSPECCLPSVGSMQGAFAAFLTACRRDAAKDTTLFIDPGFPVQKQQHRILGLKYETFDVYNFRGPKLGPKIESYLKKGNISTIIYSSPNNPSWICFTEEELKTIGGLASKHDVVVVEDLAYFAMDFRQDYSVPGAPPYQPTVANYTDNYLILFSSSKIFSYAGQRIGMIIVSDKLFNRKFPDLKKFFSGDEFGHSLVYGALYALSSGTSHSSQFALTALLKASNDGSYKFAEAVREYELRSKKVKTLFLKNGFRLVYDRDEDKDLAHGFYFTFSYGKMHSKELIRELMFYGISAISLDITGSERSEGLRGCVSQIRPEQYDIIDARLGKFNEDHRNI